ncbi:hypothetical protein FRACA_480021 [Frankia canadensis]|uniref:Uncharacterized protein n=1 Tax=Frankia canadensis TaxID=1836972 RepID=A0A2I2KXZ1_9ACTN|nr:hypothetical protein [Frankia canadensis]SNQ50532.1 hypothetical protein FRACA_480021 [Frankia canadensis]SOU57822.1 hypothetical protein FRACA_480021 [Frankia canadensis]
MATTPTPHTPSASTTHSSTAPGSRAGSLALANRWAEAPFRSRYTRWVDAPPEDVRRAMDELTLDELRLGRLLMAVRTLPSRVGGRASTAAPGARPSRVAHGDGARPMLDTFASRGFLPLCADADGIAAGIIGQFWHARVPRPVGITDADAFDAFHTPGWAKAVTTITVVPERGGSRLSTSTAIHPTDDAARRAFGRYWRLIDVPSGLIRREWLAAIARRARHARLS